MLKRPPERRVFEPSLSVGWSESLAMLVEDRFYELLDAGLWWGCADFASQPGGAKGAMEDLALGGARCVFVGARAGAAGYMVALAHPADAQRWPTRMVSEAVGFGKRPAEPAARHLFMRLGRADFPQAPRIYESNEETARSASLARVEREELSIVAKEEAPKAAAKRL